MSIVQNLTNLKNARTNIIQAINDKGVSCPTTTTLSQIPPYINSIQTDSGDFNWGGCYITRHLWYHEYRNRCFFGKGGGQREKTIHFNDAGYGTSIIFYDRTDASITAENDRIICQKVTRGAMIMLGAPIAKVLMLKFIYLMGFIMITTVLTIGLVQPFGLLKPTQN